MKKIFKNGADNNVPFKNPPHESDFDKDSSLAMRLTEQNEYLTTNEERVKHYNVVLSALQWVRKIDIENAKSVERYRRYMKSRNKVL